MNIMLSQITGHSIVCLTAYVGHHQREHQSSALLALCEGNPTVTSGFHKGLVTNKKFPCHDVIMICDQKVHLNDSLQCLMGPLLLTRIL